MFKSMILIVMSIVLLSGCFSYSDPQKDDKPDIQNSGNNSSVTDLDEMLQKTKELLHSNAPDTTEVDFNKTMFGQNTVTKEEARKSQRVHLLVATAKDPDPEWFATKADTPVIVAKSGQTYTVHLSKLRKDGSVIGAVDNDKLRFVVRIQRDKDDFEYVTDASKYVAWTAKGEFSIAVPDDLDQGRLIVGIRPNFSDVATEAIAERWSTVVTAEIWKTKPDVITLDKEKVLFPIDDAKMLSDESKFSKKEISEKVDNALTSQKVITLPMVVKGRFKAGDLVSYDYKNNPYGGEVYLVETKEDQQLILLTPKYQKVYDITDIDPNAIKDQGLYPEHIVYREGNAVNSDTNESDPTKFSRSVKNNRFHTTIDSWVIDCDEGGITVTFEPIFSLYPFDIGINMTTLATVANTECSVSPAKDGKFQIFKLPPLSGGPATILMSFLGTEIKLEPYGGLNISVDGLPKIGIKTGYSYKNEGFFNFISPTQFSYLGSRDLEDADPYRAGVEFAVNAGYSLKLNAISSDAPLGGVYSFLTLGAKKIDDVGISANIGPAISFVADALNAKEVFNTDKSSSMTILGDIKGSISISSALDDALQFFGIESIIKKDFPTYNISEIKINELEFTYSKVIDDGQGHAQLNNFCLKSANAKRVISDSRGVLSIKDTDSSVFNDKTESINYDINECEKNEYSIKTPAIGCSGWMCGKVDKPVKLCKGKLTISPVTAVARVGQTASAEATINYKAKDTTIDIAGSLLEPEVSSVAMTNGSSKKVKFSKECKEAGVAFGKVNVEAQGTPFKDEAKATLVCHDDESKGDPHMVTADKLGYDFFASGDYIISRIKDVDGYEIQARFLPGYKTSWPQAVALKVGDDTVEIQGRKMKIDRTYPFNALVIWINGEKHMVNSNYIKLPSGGIIAITSTKSDINHQKYASSLAVIWPEGSQTENYGVVLNVAQGNDPFVAIHIARPKKFAGREEGLMGNNNGDPDDDFIRRNGQQLGKDTPMSFTALYALFGADWLVRKNESLFRNPDAIKPKFPDSVTTLTPEQRALGESACRELTGFYKEACIMDVGLTGSSDLVKEYYANTEDLNALSKKIKKPNKEDTRYSMTTSQKQFEADSGYLLHYKQDIAIKKEAGEGNFVLMLRPPRGATASLSNKELSYTGSGDFNTNIEVDCTRLNDATSLEYLQSEGALQLWIQDPLSGTLDHKVSEVALSCVDDSKKPVYSMQVEKEQYEPDSGYLEHYKQNINVIHKSGYEGKYKIVVNPPRGATALLSNGELSYIGSGDFNTNIEVDCTQLNDATNLEYLQSEGALQLWIQDPLSRVFDYKVSEVALSCVDESKRAVYDMKLSEKNLESDSGYFLHYTQEINVSHISGEKGRFMLILNPPRGATAIFLNDEQNITGEGNLTAEFMLDCVQFNPDTNSSLYKQDGSLELWEIHPLTNTKAKLYTSYALNCKGELNPKQIGGLKKQQWGISKVALSYDNTKLFVNVRYSLDVVDITDMKNPKIVSSILMPIDYTISDIIVSDDDKTAFISQYHGGVQIVDITDLNNLKLIGTINSLANLFVTDITLSKDNSKLFIAENSSGVEIFDIRDLKNPKFISSINTAGLVSGVTLSEDNSKLFIGEESPGVEIFDIRDLKNPKFISSIDNIYLRDSQKIVLSKDNTKAFIAAKSGLTILDISNIKEPKVISSIGSRHVTDDIVLSDDNTMIFRTDGSSGWSIVDVSDPSNPKNISLGTDNHHLTYANNLVLSKDNTKLFIADSSWGLRIINLYD